VSGRGGSTRGPESPAEALDLLDWRRRVFSLYAEVRSKAASDPRAAWRLWRETRDELFRTHPQSPIPAPERAAFAGLVYYEYDPALRVSGTLMGRPAARIEVPASTGEPVAFTSMGACRFELGGAERSVDAYWLDAYGGGVFLPFRDATAGRETYGAGRYLLDTVKGADLGPSGADGLVLDFNFAYNPSCAYDPSWACPLAPAANRLGIEVRGGERMP